MTNKLIISEVQGKVREEGTLTANATAKPERIHVIRVPSLSNPELNYKVNLSDRSCECKRYQFSGTCIKHIVLGHALARVRARTFYTTAMREWVEEQVFEMCQRIFAPVSNHEDEAQSADLLNEVRGFRYKTPAMEQAALNRLHKIQDMRDGGAAS